MKDENVAILIESFNYASPCFHPSAFILHPCFSVPLPSRSPWGIVAYMSCGTLVRRLQLRGQWRLCTAFPDPSLVG